MIWKTFFVSFMINSSKYRNLILLDSEKTHRRQRTYSDDLENTTQYSRQLGELSLINGFDNRYNGSENVDDIILNIKKFNRKMELLKTLENNNLSNHVKVEILKKYNNYETDCSVKPNILAGGLFKDWDN